jgi:hypothetical protein
VQSAPKKPKAAFPSGLVRDWKLKVKASAGKTGSTKKNEPPSTSSVVLGGLGDNDAFSEPPLESLDFSGKKCDLKRSNEVCLVSIINICTVNPCPISSSISRVVMKVNL